MDKNTLEELNKILRNSPEGLAIFDTEKGKFAVLDYKRYENLKTKQGAKQNNEKILITGGAGYIGSHAVRALQKQGYDIVVFDNLSTGRREAVSDCRLVVGDLADREALNRLFVQEHFSTVMHFAASVEVFESMQNPDKYFQNNMINGLNLLSAMARNGVSKIIFSSTAAIYGEANTPPISEDAPKIPASPYGESKHMFERCLYWYGSAVGLKSISLRYFNAAGAWPEEDLGYNLSNPTHLIPRVMDVATGRNREIEIYGQDYPTPDGTAIRDYIHVRDLANAHILAMQNLDQVSSAEFYNIGSGRGSSVKEIIDAAIEITKRMIPMNVTNRRPGDPAIVVADSNSFSNRFNWKLSHDLRSILSSSWEWHSRSISKK